jgi:hypothetical protein
VPTYYRSIGKNVLQINEGASSGMFEIKFDDQQKKECDLKKKWNIWVDVLKTQRSKYGRIGGNG